MELSAPPPPAAPLQPAASHILRPGSMLEAKQRHGPFQRVRGAAGCAAWAPSSGAHASPSVLLLSQASPLTNSV